MKLSITFLLSLVIIYFSFGQNCCEYKTDELWVTIVKQLNITKDNNKVVTSDITLNNLFVKYNVYEFKKVFPYSQQEELMNVYKIKFNGNIDSFISELGNNVNLQTISKRIKSENIAAYNPSDYMWYLTIQDPSNWLWHLIKIEADLAWSITQGDSNIKIAILDTWFDNTHPDLSSQISPSYDPYDNTYFNANCNRVNHGTTVASFAAAQTDGGGQLASVGFNSKIIGYQAWDGSYIERAHHAALCMNANIITSSAGGWYCNTTINQLDQLALQEILDHGTTVVMPAGNGFNGTNCYYGGSFHAWKPLSPEYDERVIIVSSTDKNDYHQVIRNGIDITHSHFPEVDICAPGYDLLGAVCTLSKDSLNNCITNQWPYYGSCIGTSFATPIVAGVAALVMSVKEDLTPSQVQDILKINTDAITDAASYQGLVGSGRVNAYKAVCYTYNNYPLIIENQTLAIAKSFIRNQISISDVTFDTNAEIFIKTGNLTIDNGEFEIKNGSTLHILNYTCQ